MQQRAETASVCVVRRAESARLQAENAERSEAMQARLITLQTLKDDVNEAVRYVASLDQKVLSTLISCLKSHSCVAQEFFVLDPLARRRPRPLLATLHSRWYTLELNPYSTQHHRASDPLSVTSNLNNCPPNLKADASLPCRLSARRLRAAPSPKSCDTRTARTR